jgi:ATP-dependent Lhr-like helicase
MSRDPFDLLARPIQRSLWDMNWRELRPIQARAISVVLGTDRDLLISAQTAAGKTEAAFLPILSRIVEAPGETVRAVYVGPLKALINDQFRRLEDLCGHAEIPVHRWHGDVAASKKRALLARPAGVLLITPESMESLFVNHGGELARVFGGLEFVVIDELHAMLGKERGTHLRSLLHRLQRKVGQSFRLLALSATLGDLPRSAAWMRRRDPERVEILKDDSIDKAVRFRIFGYLKPMHPSRGDQCPESDLQRTSHREDDGPPEGLAEDLYRAFKDDRNLVFANGRDQVEMLGNQLVEMAERDGLGDRFLVHHGSLSKDLREHTESLMQADGPRTTVCSSTLELGIDIGNVTSVGQVGPPWSVSSLVQRLGRSGRKEGQPHSMRLYVIEDESGPHGGVVERLFPDLLQGIALAELMRQKWVESPEIPEYDFSTLTHQMLSLIAETGGLSAKDLHRTLCVEGAFDRVESGMLAKLMRSLAQYDLIEQSPDGRLILGLAGEKIVRHYSFYSAFATSMEYEVVYAGKVLGALPLSGLPKAGVHVVFAARRWIVERIDSDRKQIVVVPAQGKKAPRFDGSAGLIHPRVRKEMRRIALDDHLPPYLDPVALKMLLAAREFARDLNLFASWIVPLSPSRCLWLTWTGSRAHRTLELALESIGVPCQDDSGLGLVCGVSAGELVGHLSELDRDFPDSLRLASLEIRKQRRKFDEFVSAELLDLAFARDGLDLTEALLALRATLLAHDSRMFDLAENGGDLSEGPG